MIAHCMTCEKHSQMRANPTVYEPMSARNGWGTYESCLEFLCRVALDLRSHPKATVHVSH